MIETEEHQIPMWQKLENGEFNLSITTYKKKNIIPLIKKINAPKFKSIYEVINGELLSLKWKWK